MVKLKQSVGEGNAEFMEQEFPLRIGRLVAFLTKMEAAMNAPSHTKTLKETVGWQKFYFDFMGFESQGAPMDDGFIPQSAYHGQGKETRLSETDEQNIAWNNELTYDAHGALGESQFEEVREQIDELFQTAQAEGVDINVNGNQAVRVKGTNENDEAGSTHWVANMEQLIRNSQVFFGTDPEANLLFVNSRFGAPDPKTDTTFGENIGFDFEQSSDGVHKKFRARKVYDGYWELFDITDPSNEIDLNPEMHPHHLLQALRCRTPMRMRIWPRHWLTSPLNR